MRILIVTQYFWPESFRINDVALGLAERGHQVSIYTGLPNYPGGRFFPGYGFRGPLKDSYKDLPIRRAPLLPRGDGGSLRLALNFASFAASATFLAPFLCRGAFDVILVFEPSPVTVGIPALALKLIKRAPVLFWVQDLWPQTLSATGAIKSPLLISAVDKLVRWIYRGCDRVLVQSRAFVDPIQEQGVARDHIIYLPNSAEEFYRRVERSNDDAAASEFRPGFRVLFAGNVGAAQDFPGILAAAALLREHREIQWTVLGEGRMFAWAQSQVIKLDLESTVQLLGARPASQMPAYFAHADVLLATLRRDPIFAYTIPSKIQSYMACGKAIIAALDGEGASVVREAGAGWVVPPENPRALADAVLVASLTEKSQLEAMGNSGNTYFREHFERNLLLARLEGLLSEVAGDPI